MLECRIVKMRRSSKEVLSKLGHASPEMWTSRHFQDFVRWQFPEFAQAATPKSWEAHRAQNLGRPPCPKFGGAPCPKFGATARVVVPTFWQRLLNFWAKLFFCDRVCIFNDFTARPNSGNVVSKSWAGLAQILSTAFAQLLGTGASPNFGRGRVPKFWARRLPNCWAQGRPQSWGQGGGPI